MKNILLLLVLIGFTSASAQKKEFAGLVKYKHNVIAKQKDYDVNYDYAGIGKNSDYYYKNGNIKWLTVESYFRVNWFVAKEDRDYLLTSKSDTVFTPKNTAPDFEITEYKILPKTETILGHKCQILQLTLKGLTPNSPVSYRRYFFSSDFYIDPKKMANCKSNAYDVIYGQMKSIPLKIEYEFPMKTVIWEAVEVKPMQLGDDMMGVPEGAVVVRW